MQCAIDHPDIVFMELDFPGMTDSELRLLEGSMGDRADPVSGDPGLGCLLVAVSGIDGRAGWNFDEVYPIALFFHTGRYRSHH